MESKGSSATPEMSSISKRTEFSGDGYKNSRFQSYRFTAEPFIVSIDKSKVPEAVLKKLEEMSKKLNITK